MEFLHPVSGTTPQVVAALGAWLAAPGEPPPLVVETSGSTGLPKRVVLSRAAVLASVRATERRLGGSGRWLLALPASYVAGVQVICRSLVAGHPPVVLDEHPSFAEATAATLSGAGGPAAFVSLVPTQLHRLLEVPEDGGGAARVPHRAARRGSDRRRAAGAGGRRGRARGGDVRVGRDRRRMRLRRASAGRGGAGCGAGRAHSDRRTHALRPVRRRPRPDRGGAGRRLVPHRRRRPARRGRPAARARADRRRRPQRRGQRPGTGGRRAAARAC